MVVWALPDELLEAVLPAEVAWVGKIILDVEDVLFAAAAVLLAEKVSIDLMVYWDSKAEKA